LHGANDQKVLAGGDRESVGAGFTDSGRSQLTTARLPKGQVFSGRLWQTFRLYIEI